jgi:hypothetical protein
MEQKLTVKEVREEWNRCYDEYKMISDPLSRYIKNGADIVQIKRATDALSDWFDYEIGKDLLMCRGLLDEINKRYLPDDGVLIHDDAIHLLIEEHLLFKYAINEEEIVVDWVTTCSNWVDRNCELIMVEDNNWWYDNSGELK